MKKEQICDFSINRDNGDWFDEEPTSEIYVEETSREISENTTRKDSTPRVDKTWRWSITIACIILGIIVSLLFRTYKSEGQVNTIYGQRRDLAEMVKYLQTERNKLQADLSKAREIISDLEKASSRGKSEFETLRKQLNVHRQEAGLTPVRGPGIIVRLDDSPMEPKVGDDPNYYIVHDIDLMALVNELWASGAEAISINEQRLVMTSAIRCVGPTITVNTVRLTPPYVVKAIGPPSNLETGLRYRGGFMDSMSPNIERGVVIKISREKDIKIPAFKGSLVNRYAKTYKPEEKEEQK